MSMLLFLALGWCVLIVLAMRKGFAFPALLRMSFDGIRRAANVLIFMSLIGILTGLWRSSGTIAYIVNMAMKLLHPDYLPITIFLLNALVSFIIGTSFGTAATMGVVCMVVANASGLPPILSGGAVLSGIFFGDRCSPISSSAMLVADVTGTKLYDNIRRMFRSAVIPFALTCAVYLAAGMLLPAQSGAARPDDMFQGAFVASPILLLPAAAVLIPAVLRVNTKITLLLSSSIALVLSMLVQHQAPAEALSVIWSGYQAADPAIGVLINGGGLSSVLKVLGIVCLSSTYAGILRGTGLANGIEHRLHGLAAKIGTNACTVVVAVFSCMVGCNQTLAIMMTAQFCEPLYNGDHARFANVLEDTVVVIAALVPWSIAGAVPIASIGAPTACLLGACYLYFLPIAQMMRRK